MGALDDLLGKKKPKPPLIGDSIGDPTLKHTPKIDKTGTKLTEFSLNLNPPAQISEEKPDAEIPQAVQPETAGIVDSGDDSADPFAGLAGALDGISFDPAVKDACIPSGIETHSEPAKQFANPTLYDVEKFVFEEQPDSSTEEITEAFSTMLDDLSLATGDQVPTNVARCLKFIKEHDFLADILRPEAIGVLVNGLRKSYGFIVKTKTEKGAKKAKQNEKVSAVLDSLADLSF